MGISYSDGGWAEDEFDHTLQQTSPNSAQGANVPETDLNRSAGFLRAPGGIVADLPPVMDDKQYYKTNIANPDSNFNPEIHIIRHGSTAMNNHGDVGSDKIRGWADIPLSDDGRAEAEETGKSLKDSGITAIVASDLDRAKETAEIIGRHIGVEPTTSMKLRPWDLGNMTGCISGDCIPTIKDYVNNRPGDPVPGGESFNNFKARAIDGVREAIQTNPNQNIAIVTHHRVERLLNAWDAAGQPDNLDIDNRILTQKGDPPGSFQKITIGKPVTTADAQSMTHQPEVPPDKVQKVVSGLTNQLSDALVAPAKLTKDFYEGKTNSDDPEAIGKAFEVISNAAGLGVSGAEKNALGMFGGRMSKAAVGFAEQMEKRGFSETTIKEMSGLERGADDKWRREFSDDKAKLDLTKFEGDKNVGHAELGEILDHPELYKTYPEAKKIFVTTSPHEKAMGSFYRDLDAISLKSGRDPEDMKSTLMHEVQHWIQHKEGFSLTAPSEIESDLADKLKGSYIRNGNKDQLRYVIEQLGQGNEKEARSMAQNILDQADYKLYKNQASETEARNTQNRLNMTDKQRRHWLGRATEDVDREDQIIAK